MRTSPKTHHQFRVFFFEPRPGVFFAAILDGAGLGLLGPMLHGLAAEFADFLDEESLHFVGGAKGGVALCRGRQAQDGFKLLEEFGPGLEFFDELLEPSPREGVVLAAEWLVFGVGF